jgi:hypothetical protein
MVKLEYEYVFKDTEELIRQIETDIQELFISPKKYVIYETDEKIIVELSTKN